MTDGSCKKRDGALKSWLGSEYDINKLFVIPRQIPSAAFSVTKG